MKFEKVAYMRRKKEFSLVHKKLVRKRMSLDNSWKKYLALVRIKAPTITIYITSNGRFENEI